MKRLMTKYIPGMLTCEEVDSFLYDFQEGQLSYLERLKFKLHLSMCKECKDYLRNYQSTIRMSQAEFTKVDTAEKVPEALIDAILKSRTKK
jgi:predicted anti-sigma-YlaC factor YlaD